MPTRLRAVFGTMLALGLSAAAQPAAVASYRDHVGVLRAARALADASPRCAFGSLGRSAEGREIIVLTLSDDHGKADRRPALLLTAGLDGRHLVGTETALRVAERLVADHADLLSEMTVYVIPSANPDGRERNLVGTRAGHVGNMRPLDDDRDGLTDEDGPNDLDGNGLITQMRRVDPPLDDPPTHMADPVEPRLLKKPDRKEGERATYSVYVEGLDDDGDGLVAEDPPGAVDIDRNFMHEWPEHARDAGAYQLSEPESLALASFVLAHKNIVMAITYGRHDNLAQPPDGKGRDVSGKGPKVIDPGDVKLYESVSELFKETTGQERAPKESADGSFHAWLYAQRGIPSFATVVWGRPDEEKPDDEAPPAPESDAETPENAGETATAAGQWSGTASIPEFGDFDYTLSLEEAPDHSVTGTYGSQMFNFDVSGTFDPSSGALVLAGAVGPDASVAFSLAVDGDQLAGSVTAPDGQTFELSAERVADSPPDGGDEKGKGKKGKEKPADAEAAAWLKHSDEVRTGAGFVEWAPFDHPTLGAVEIGGFVPGFRMNPPPDEIDALAEAQTAFVVALTERRPKLLTSNVEVTRLADGLYEVRLALVNEGEFPTATAMARKARSVPPTVIRMSLPVERIVTGNRVNRAWGIDGSGGREVFHWILRVDDGADIDIEIDRPQFGTQTLTVTAEEVSS